MATITAQALYDWRDRTGAISGTELHQLFQTLTGDPSPRGRTPIFLAALAMLAATDADADAAYQAMAALERAS
mgnify:CR=1 FL=1